MLVQEKGPQETQETSDWKSEIRTWGGAGAGGSAELLASQAPQEEDDDDPEKVEDEEEPQEEDDDDQAKVEDEDASATEEWESEGEHEGVGADDGAQSFLSRRLPRRRMMTLQTRCRMRKRLPPRKRSRRWTL